MLEGICALNLPARVLLPSPLQEEEDEYQRMLNIRAYVAATGLTLTVCTGWGFLQDFAGLPQISLHHVFVIFCVCQGLTTGWTRITNR